MKRQTIRKIAQMTLATTAMLVALTAFSATTAAAASLTVDPATSGAPAGEWLDVLVGFGMLLVIGLGGLWVSQHQMKLR
ncbi:MAG: hypothetical protein KA765_01550 [Thermoflexales bacterium]|nr:hypothetical protein [Thermoflexales bacterium]